MHYYPVFLELSGQSCLVVGAGAVGRRKIASLLECPIERLHVIDLAEPDTNLQVLLEDKRVSFTKRPFTPSDVEGCALVFAATSNRQTNDAVARACAERGILCNCADAPKDTSGALWIRPCPKPCSVGIGKRANLCSGNCYPSNCIRISWSCCMILPELLPVLAIHLYALGTAAVVAGILARNEWLKRAALVLTVLAFTTHTLLLIATFMDDGFTGLTRSVYVQLLAWCITLSGLVAWLRWRYEALLLTVAPFSLLTFLIALLLRHAETPLPPVLSGMTFTIHIAAIFISIGLMALAFGAGVLFLIQAKSIKSKSKLAGFQKDLPALSALDKINAFTTTVGFPLFTAGVLFGFISARINWGTILSGDPKEFISLVVWGLYAWLFHQRFTQGWQGRKPAILAIWIFTVCAFSLIVVNLFMTTHHSFLTTPR